MKYKMILSILSLMLFVGCSPSNAPSEGDLGLANSSGLVGGLKAESSQAGFLSTAIIFKAGNPDCTAVLIHPQMILTAGHCLANRSISDLEIVLSANVDRTYQVIASQLHQDYFHSSFSEGNLGRSNIRNDVAILVLDEPASSDAQIAQLAHAPASVGESMSLWAFGSGRSKGSATDGGFMQSVLLEGQIIPEAPLKISFDQRSGRGLCKGDSGGPIFKIESGQPVLFGIISSADKWQLNNGRLVGDICEYYGLATQVGAYAEWIQKTKSQLAARIR